ncbi:macrophage mannose receptor 1 [Plakobranchus ocellatus]|uniref:Macrophage mannose receptor 1 n=1 Tax=Plakobranchus ocellatus TaxID=259542 RepID=A0AAV4DPB9_9GAST|nr:macrophage mannose receptor 1 [Plakobranchus ocellatus]
MINEDNKDHSLYDDGCDSDDGLYDNDGDSDNGLCDNDGDSDDALYDNDDYSDEGLYDGDRMLMVIVVLSYMMMMVIVMMINLMLMPTNTNWRYGYPDADLWDPMTGAEECAVAVNELGAPWHNYVCFLGFSHICEKPLPSTASCTPGWKDTPSGEVCITLFDNPAKNWFDARRACQNAGGNLVIIRDDTMNNFIKDHVVPNNLCACTGLHTIPGEHKWYWLDEDRATERNETQAAILKVQNSTASVATLSVTMACPSDPVAKARYLEKIKTIGGRDPYTIAGDEFSFNLDELPEITYPDIFSYLVLEHSKYTADEFKVRSFLIDLRRGQFYVFLVCF